MLSGWILAPARASDTPPLLCNTAGVETPARFMRHVADLTATDHLALEVDGGSGGGFFRFGS